MSRRKQQSDNTWRNQADQLKQRIALLTEQGKYEEALSPAVQLSDLVRQHSEKISSAYVVTLANLYFESGDYARAELLYLQALEIDRAMLGERHPDVATDLTNLAGLYRKIGDYARAESASQQALEIRRTMLGEQHPAVATSLTNLALLYFNIGRYAKAEPLLQQALEIDKATLGEWHPHVVTDLNNLAVLYIATDRQNDAWPLLQRSAAVDDYLIQQIFSVGSERQRMVYLATLQAQFAFFLSVVLQHFPETLEKVQAAFDLVLRRKAIGAEALAAQRDALLAGHYPALLPMLQELTILRAQIALKSMEGPDSVDLTIYHPTLEAWNTRKEQLETHLAHQIQEIRLQQQLHGANRQAIAATLPQDSALIEFVRVHVLDFHTVRVQGGLQWKAARYLAFVLLAAEPDTVQMIDLGEAERIDQLIRAFRTSITGEHEWGRDRQVILAKGVPSYTTSGNEGTALRATIFDPLVAALRDCKRLFLAPDGDLARLPFEVLPISNGARLIDEYHLSYLGVGRDTLRFNMPFTRQSGESLVAADPAFDLGLGGKMSSPQAVRASQGKYSRDLHRNGLQFSPLPNTRVEGKQIAKLFKVQPLLGASVLAQSLKAASSPRILHIATHGFFLEDQQRDLTASLFTLGKMSVASEGKLPWLLQQENPLLRSGLALAGANSWLQ